MDTSALTTLAEKIDRLGELVIGLYGLVVVVGIYLGWSLRRIARNQVDSARLLEQATERLEKDLAEQTD